MVYGRLFDDVVADLQANRLTAAKLPIDYVVREGNVLMLNTRSAKALEAAGIPRNHWYVRNVTGELEFENMLNDQLMNNKLMSAGIPLDQVVRSSGAPRLP